MTYNMYNFDLGKYLKKFSNKRCLCLKRKALDYIRINVFYQNLTDKFLSIKRTINLIVFMKELKINSGYSKYFRSLKNKGTILKKINY